MPPVISLGYFSAAIIFKIILGQGYEILLNYLYYDVFFSFMGEQCSIFIAMVFIQAKIVKLIKDCAKG